MKNLDSMEITEILTNFDKATEKTLKTTIFKAYNKGQLDGLKNYFEMKMQELKDSFIERDTYDMAVADIHDTYLLDETQKESLTLWLAERVDGKEYDEEFMKILNDDLNKRIIEIVQSNQLDDFRNFMKR